MLKNYPLQVEERERGKKQTSARGERETEYRNDLVSSVRAREKERERKKRERERVRISVNALQHFIPPSFLPTDQEAGGGTLLSYTLRAQRERNERAVQNKIEALPLCHPKEPLASRGRRRKERRRSRRRRCRRHRARIPPCDRRDTPKKAAYRQ